MGIHNRIKSRLEGLVKQMWWCLDYNNLHMKDTRNHLLGKSLNWLKAMGRECLFLVIIQDKFIKHYGIRANVYWFQR